ncbi:MAG: helix-turn-helix domain-containing protein [Candidatus Acidiferrales bacterium]
MAVESLNVREAAEALGFSVRSVKRAAQDGSLRYFLTPGKHYRFRRADLEAFAQGRTGSGFEAPASSTLQNRRERIAELNLEGQEIRSRRQLEEIRREDEESRREREESVRRAEQERTEQRQRERIEQDRQAAHEAAARERIVWENQFLSDALTALPHDAPPDVILAAGEAVRESLAPFGPGETQQLITIVVSAAIKRALASWTRSKEVACIVKKAEELLPVLARIAFSEPTEWQNRFRAAASEAIRALPADASIEEIRAEAHQTARKIAADFERVQMEKIHFRDCRLAVDLVAFRVLPDDCERASQTVRDSLARLPIGCDGESISKAASRALAPFLRRKEAGEQAECYLRHIAIYIEELGAPGADWDLGDFFERRDLAEKLEKKIRPKLIQQLLAGEIEDEEDAQEFIEDFVDRDIEAA